MTRKGSVHGLLETDCDGCFATRILLAMAMENAWLRNTEWNNNLSFASRTEFGLNDICHRVYLFLNFFLGGVLGNLSINSFI